MRNLSLWRLFRSIADAKVRLFFKLTKKFTCFFMFFAKKRGLIENLSEHFDTFHLWKCRLVLSVVEQDDAQDFCPLGA